MTSVLLHTVMLVFENHDCQFNLYGRMGSAMNLQQFKSMDISILRKAGCIDKKDVLCSNVLHTFICGNYHDCQSGSDRKNNTIRRSTYEQGPDV